MIRCGLCREAVLYNSTIFVADTQVDDMVLIMDESLRAEGCSIAAKLRAAGRSVDLVLEPKKMKWAFKQAER